MESSEALPSELERFWRTDDGLTACERAVAYGIDLSLLEENLRLAPGERLQRHAEKVSQAERLAALFLSSGEQLQIGEAELLAVTIDAVIHRKRATGRPRDLHAVLELEAIRERLRG